MMDLLFTKTPLAFFIQSLWRDEAFSYLLAKMNIFKMLSLTAQDSNPPLYYLALKIWSAVFGSTEIALRSLSLLFFWLTGYLIYKIMDEIFHIPLRKIIVFIALYAINPLFTYYAYEARMYSMFAFFSAWSFYAFLKHDRKQFFWATLLNLYTHYFSLFVLGVEFLFVFFRHGWKLPRLERGWKVNLRRFLSFIKVEPLVYFLPWLAFVMAVNRNDTGSFWLKPSRESWLYAPAHLFSGYYPELGFLNPTANIYLNFYTIFAAFILVLLVVGYISQIRQRHYDSIAYRFLLLIFLLPVILLLAISIFRPIFLSRYMIFSSVALFILILLAINRAPFPTNLLYILIIAMFSLQYNKLAIKYRAKSSFTKTVSEVKALAKAGDVIYTDELNFHTLQYYFGENNVYIYGKSYADIPWYVGKILMPKDRFTYQLPVYPRKAFIINWDGSYKIKSIL